MSHPAFLALARDTYLGLLGCIEVVDIHAHVLNELASEARAEERQRKSRRRPTNSAGDDSTPATPQSSSSLFVPGQGDDRPSLSLATSAEALDRPPSPSSTSDDATATDISDVVHAIAELANLRFSKVIGVRTEVHAALELAEFVEIFDASWAFVLQCEVICQRMIVGLRGVMVGQAKTFLQTFHQKRLTDSARLVENEQWVASDVKPSTQAVVNLILQGAMRDPEEFLLGQRRRDKDVQALPASTEEGALAKQVDIEGRQYFAVAAGLTTLEVLCDYIKVVVNCPLLTTDAMSKVIEFMKVRPPLAIALWHPPDVDSSPVFQLAHMSSRARSWCHALRRSQEHHRQTSRSVASSVTLPLALIFLVTKQPSPPRPSPS